MNLRVSLKPEQFVPSAFPRRINLGSGNDVRDGYLNIDMNAWNHPDLLADVRKLDFLPESYYEELLAQDVLEHLPRTETLPTLVHWNRLLLIGGRITIRVPSVLGLADLLRHPGYQHPSKQEDLMQCLFGTQAYTGDFHYTSFTRVLLEHYLGQSGFRPLRMDVLYGWLFDCEAEKVRHIGRPISRDFKELLPIEDDETFVRTCYLEILRREPDPGGQEYFLSGLRAGGLTREAMIASMLSSSEFRALRPG